MSEYRFNSIYELYDHLKSRGGASPEAHGQLGNFYAHMVSYTNPNTCSCKKGKKALNMILSSARLIGSATDTVRQNCLSLFDGKGMILNYDGAELSRL